MTTDNRVVSIVDDDKDITVLFNDALGSIERIRMLSFIDPILALEHFLFSDHTYAVVICDSKMPRLNGMELLKKIIKILVFFAGSIVALLLYLQQLQVISVDVEKMEASSTFIFNSVASSFDKMTQTGDMSTLGIPLAGGLSAGLAIGFMKG